jgi:hypothetical protein
MFGINKSGMKVFKIKLVVYPSGVYKILYITTTTHIGLKDRGSVYRHPQFEEIAFKEHRITEVISNEQHYLRSLGEDICVILHNQP